MIKGKILLVDDTPSTIEMVRSALESKGYEVFVATTGEKALKRAELTAPDIILLDIIMPGMDGYETCTRLKINEKTLDIPVIFTSALTDTFDKVKGFRLGAVDYLAKPIETEELLSRVHTHFDDQPFAKRITESKCQTGRKSARTNSRTHEGKSDAAVRNKRTQESRRNTAGFRKSTQKSNFPYGGIGRSRAKKIGS